MSIKQRLYPDDEQAAGMVAHCHHARFVFNIGLEQRSMWRRSKHERGESLSALRVTSASQMRELAQLRTDLDWLRAGSSSVQQAALRDLDRAFSNFFSGRAKYPSFKRRNERQGSFTVRDLTVRKLNRRWGVVTVPKVGPVRFRITLAWANLAAATSARVTHKNGRWHVAFTTPPAEKIEAGTGAAVGIDRGVKNTLALSDGRMIQAPTFTTAEQVRFLALQRRLSRQTTAAKMVRRPLSECRNREKTLAQMAVLRRRIEDRRTDWIEQTTTRLARNYNLIAVEDLRVQYMVRRPTPKRDPANEDAFLPNGAHAKAALNKAILASCWGRFLDRLEHKMPEGHVVRVDPKNTSRTCAVCGHCATGNRESQAVFECEACGHAAHADTNAADNILARGLSVVFHPEPTDSGGSPAHRPIAVPQEPGAGVISPPRTEAA